jgi:hypothetical protein
MNEAINLRIYEQTNKSIFYEELSILTNLFLTINISLGFTIRIISYVIYKG